MAGSPVVTVLSVTIGLFFILVGSLKLTPLVSEDVYKEMRKGFIRFAKVFPLAGVTGWKPGANTYRRVVGVTEVVCGLLLAFIPGRVKQFANVALLVLLVGALYSHWMLGDSLDKMTSALIFTLLLVCRFIVRMQVQAREKRTPPGPPAQDRAPLGRGLGREDLIEMKPSSERYTSPKEKRDGGGEIRAERGPVRERRAKGDKGEVGAGEGEAVIPPSRGQGEGGSEGHETGASKIVGKSKKVE